MEEVVFFPRTTSSFCTPPAASDFRIFLVKYLGILAPTTPQRPCSQPTTMCKCFLHPAGDSVVCIIGPTTAEKGRVEPKNFSQDGNFPAAIFLMVSVIFPTISTDLHFCLTMGISAGTKDPSLPKRFCITHIWERPRFTTRMACIFSFLSRPK